MVRIQDFHSWHTGSIPVESTNREALVTTGDSINQLVKVMAKNVESPAAKSRQTKLSKKSAEELIQIILRKDKTEKNLSAQIINLKNEVNNLTSRIKGYDLDSEGDAKTIAELKKQNSIHVKHIAELTDRNVVLNEQITNLQVLVKNAKDNYNAASYDASTMYDKAKSLRTLCWTLIFGWAITIIAIAIL